MRTLRFAPAAVMLALLACHDQPTGPAGVALALSADSHDFGEVESGQSSKPFPLTVTNTGFSTTRTLTAGFTNLTGEFHLSQDDCSGRTLEAGASCQIDITMLGSGSGIARTVLTVGDSPSDTASAALQGVMVFRRIFVTNENVGDFGHVAVGTVSPPRTFILENQGTVVTATLRVFLTGESAEFHVTDDECTGHALNPQDVCTVTVEFQPQVSGTKQAYVFFAGAPSEWFVAGLSGDS